MVADLVTWTRHLDVLWQFLLPGLFEFEQKAGQNVKFLYFGSTNGYVFHGHFAKTNTSTASSSKKIGEGEYNSDSWKSQLPPGETKLDLGKLMGIVEAEERRRKWTGLIPIDSMVAKSQLKTGLDVARALFTDTAVISIDTGFVNMVGAVAAFGEVMTKTGEDGQEIFDGFKGEFKRYLVKSRGKYSATGTDALINDRIEEMSNKHTEAMAKLSENHGRVMKAADYEKFAEAFRQEAPDLLETNSAEATKKQKQKKARLTQRYYSNFRNTLLALADALYSKKLETNPGTKRKRPVVIFGKASFGTMAGQRSANPVWLMNYLKRFFVVIVVDEYNSSQKCPVCLTQLQSYGTGVRLKKCPECTSESVIKNDDGSTAKKTHPFIVNRDIAAPMCMLRIVLSMVLFGRRPVEFTPLKKPHQVDSKKEQKPKKPRSDKGKPRSNKAKGPEQAQQGGTASESLGADMNMD